MDFPPLYTFLLTLLFSFKVGEAQLKLIYDGLVDCVVNKYIPPVPSDIHFHLYTRNNLDSPEVLGLPDNDDIQKRSENKLDVLKPNGEQTELKRPRESKHFLPIDDKSNLTSIMFNTVDDTKILIHGYNQSSQSEAMGKMKSAYMIKGNYNVIVVDWSEKAKSKCYPRVTKLLPDVGRIVARFVDLLVAAGASLDKIHLIGFSLGAHVAGYAGTFNNGTVARITGLDPASPLIKSVAVNSLDSTDAGLVDLIHTSTDFYGKGKPMGHVDFYPNGGKKQPGCAKSRFDACSHGRAVQFFTESINSPAGFPASKCGSWPRFLKDECTNSTKAVLMGDPCPHGIEGRYFLTTGDKTPFAIRS